MVNLFGIFIQSFLIGFSGAVMPGSLLTYTIERSMKSGAKAGLLISLGHALLELLLVILLLLGVGKYLGTTVAQIIIGFTGGIMLLFFGFGMLRDVFKGKITANFKNTSDSRNGSMMLSGALISIANPYFTV
jgi:threonine/homoserine/homoserine lactone efflux protein